MIGEKSTWPWYLLILLKCFPCTPGLLLFAPPGCLLWPLHPAGLGALPLCSQRALVFHVQL